MNQNAPTRIAVVESADDIARCYSVMHELRPLIANETELVERVTRQHAEGYRLVSLSVKGVPRAVAGYRIMQMLFSGRLLYVDDLVTRAEDRSLGFGDKLFDWLVAKARANDCVTLELDSNVQRFAAHRFYLRKRMAIEAHHFRLKV